MKRFINGISVLMVLLVISAFSIEPAQAPGNISGVGIEVGNTAPDIELKDPNGKTIQLSSLRGKMVLIDFWASWCGPCRRENPSLVKAYDSYKDKNFTNGKGFTIYSVSLDKSEKAWTQAIDQDMLKWDSHVSDLKGWNSSAAALYSVNSIPTNFLIDGNGVILARGLRGQALEAALAKHAK